MEKIIIYGKILFAMSQIQSVQWISWWKKIKVKSLVSQIGESGPSAHLKEKQYDSKIHEMLEFYNQVST